MVKSTGLLLLCIYLTLQQHIAAQPFQADTKLNELQQPHITKTNEASFVQALEPVIVATLDGVDKYFNTLIAESARFVADLLKELKALPADDAYVRALTPRLTSMLERLSAAPSNDRNSLIRDIGDMYAEFDNILHSKDEDSKASVLKKVLDKLQLLELNWRVHSAVDDAVRKFRRAFEQFWDTLSDAQQRQHQRLADWYEHFKAGESSKDQLTGLKEFLQMALELVPINQN
ncbi:uncharacterized protein LOC105211448 isoform X1 [Zeugodacus cucurbitae]|uniref:uncharacterized protein LOC105211448 isoform X1 n=1 Tax=Zeugodacus cucurbitae TaxID=28588 RepID=UPI0023D96204|nr:uncharacterized protein LOC105211448 isoform X1 [Zeugodacus cucurbitae]